MTGSPEFGYLIEAIKTRIPADKLERAAKAGEPTMKQVILTEFFKDKRGMSRKKANAVDNLFIQHDLAGKIVDEISAVEKNENDALMDDYIYKRKSGLEVRREMKSRGYDADAFWDWYAVRVDETKVKEETKEAVRAYNYAKRHGLMAALPQETVDRARVGFATIARSGVLKRWIARREGEKV